MSLIDVDSWITEYEACDRLCRDIQAQIVQRNHEPTLSKEYTKISSNVRIRLKQFTNDLIQLRKKLNIGKITPQEEERRQRQIELLESKLVHLQTQFTNAASVNSARNQLMTGGSSRLWENDDSDDDDVPIHKINPLNGRQGNSGGGGAGAGAGGSNDNFTVEDMRKDQTRMLEDQNNGLDALSKIISRQKNLALQIGDEVDVQNDIIDDLAYDIERTDSRINSETRHVGVVSHSESSTCFYWVIIIALFVAILLVSFL